MIRSPAVAGHFYFYDSGMLLRQIQDFMDEGAVRRGVLGVMVPHAGFMYSGRVAGMVYSRINPADSYVILGPNHTGMGPPCSLMREGLWRTPLGDVRVNSDLAEDIVVRSKYLEEDVLAHEYEHSVEVQLPFLQFLGGDFEFVPIVLAHMSADDGFLGVCRDVGMAIAGAMKKTRERVVVVASTDLTHYEPQNVAEGKDRAVLDAVVSLNPKKLFEEVSGRDVSMCGFGPTAVMLYACLALGASKGELAGYMTSGDVTGDLREVVGYGGVLVE
jgi:AmmeMemoRadiSam system protein B